jgi:hypothetical protein
MGQNLLVPLERVPVVPAKKYVPVPRNTFLHPQKRSCRISDVRYVTVWIMIWDKYRYGYLTRVPRAGRGEWYEKTGLSNGDEVAGMSQQRPGTRRGRSPGPWRVTQLEESHLFRGSMPLLSQITVNSLLLPPFRWSRTGFQIVTVLMWLKDEFCAKFLFVQLIASIDSTLNPAAILTVFRFNWDRSFYVWMLTSSSCYDITTLANLKKITRLGKYFRIFCCFTNGCSIASF